MTRWGSSKRRKSTTARRSKSIQASACRRQLDPVTDGTPLGAPFVRNMPSALRHAATWMVEAPAEVAVIASVIGNDDGKAGTEDAGMWRVRRCPFRTSSDRPPCLASHEVEDKSAVPVAGAETSFFQYTTPTLSTVRVSLVTLIWTVCWVRGRPRRAYVW
jgi:hypothetical protein